MTTANTDETRPAVTGRALALADRKPVVFFDGQCPLCRREISHYRNRRGAANLEWVDISRPEAQLERYGISHADAMARFHVLDSQGVWRIGAWGFAELWSYLPAYRWLSWTVRRLRLLPLLDRAYHSFARWRLQRQCSDLSCTTRET